MWLVDSITEAHKVTENSGEVATDREADMLEAPIADARLDAHESAPSSGSEDVLSELLPMLRAAEDFAEGWPDIYRQEVFRIAVSRLLGEDRRETPNIPRAVGGTAIKPLVSVDTSTALPVDRLATQLGAETTEVERVVHFSEDGQFQILPRIEGASNRERQILYSLVYCYVQEMALGTRQVDADELRKLCVENGCYDGPNFSTNFKKAGKDDLIREIDKGTRSRKYMATKKGLDTAATLLRQMLEQ
jgi:hypothetical protein